MPQDLRHGVAAVAYRVVVVNGVVGRGRTPRLEALGMKFPHQVGYGGGIRRGAGNEPVAVGLDDGEGVSQAENEIRVGTSRARADRHDEMGFHEAVLGGGQREVLDFGKGLAACNALDAAVESCHAAGGSSELGFAFLPLFRHGYLLGVKLAFQAEK